ncbi:STAS/SEC14 domain-containing protein [candidate division WOR-3 bacterium]|nr:STAS/SEC14 domain-containing protein [candidate division WOR-3 bacterium]
MKHEVWLNEDEGVLFVRYKGDITVADYGEVSDRVLEFSPEQRLLTLVDMSEAKVSALDRKSRAAIDERVQSLLHDNARAAIVITSPVIRMMTKIFLGTVKQKVETRIFADTNEALAWLKGEK